jgi:tetrahydromethanopterin S-methyltransferase subunit G
MKLGKHIKWLKRLVEREREAEIEMMKREIKGSLWKRKGERVGRAILDLKGKVVGREFSFRDSEIRKRKRN